MTYADRRDVVVVGLGSIGSMALWQLARRGADVLGIERFGRVHTHGAYAGESRLFRVAAKEGEVFVPALLRSRELWLELGAAYGQDPLLPVGALSVGPRGHPALDATLSAIRRYDLPHSVFDAGELRARYPQFYVEDDDIGVLDTLGGATRSELAVVAATELALGHGASVRYDTAVTAIEPRPDGVRVVTPDGEVLAGRVVLTAGPWTTRLLPDLADIVRVSSHSLLWFIPRHISLFTPDRFPGFMRDLHGVHAFGVPSLDGYSVKAVPSLGLPVADDWDDRVTALPRERLKWAGEQIRRMFPDLIPEPSRWSVHGESTAFSSTGANKMPVIDTVADGSVVVATALSGNGFKFAPVWGEMLADLATKGEGRFTSAAFTIDGHRATGGRKTPALALTLRHHPKRDSLSRALSLRTSSRGSWRRAESAAFVRDNRTGPGRTGVAAAQPVMPDRTRADSGRSRDERPTCTVCTPPGQIQLARSSS